MTSLNWIYEERREASGWNTLALGDEDTVLGKSEYLHKLWEQVFQQPEVVCKGLGALVLPSGNPHVFYLSYITLVLSGKMFLHWLLLPKMTQLFFTILKW